MQPLRYRDFRLLWAGLAVSLVGSGKGDIPCRLTPLNAQHAEITRTREQRKWLI